jgi:hypothetical protein
VYALNRRALTSSLINRGSGLTTADGSVPLISILISIPALCNLAEALLAENTQIVHSRLVEHLRPDNSLAQAP